MQKWRKKTNNIKPYDGKKQQQPIQEQRNYAAIDLGTTNCRLLID